MVPTRSFHHIAPRFRPFFLRQLSSLSPLRNNNPRPSGRPLNLLSKYSSHPPPSSASPGLLIPTPPLPHSPLAPDESTPIPVAPKPAVEVSFSRSGDREEKRGGGVDDAFVVDGIKVPERPLKPGEEDCCMSGCVHCVYDIYASSLLAYQEALSQVHTALLASSRPRSQWPAVILEREKRGVAGNVKELSLEEMDPGMKAFLEMESRLKEAKKVKG